MGELRKSCTNPEEEGGYGRFSTGILPSHVLKRLIAGARNHWPMSPSPLAQIQPASIDLRLGPVAFRVRASFLPGKTPPWKKSSLRSSCMRSTSDQRRGAGGGLRLYRQAAGAGGILGPHLRRRQSQKLSTGRIDVFTRLITDYAPSFDRVEAGYRGPLYAEISPQTFPILVRKGSRLNQLRIRHGSPQLQRHALRRLHAEQAAGGR
jgi:dCTP deaminase